MWRVSYGSFGSLQVFVLELIEQGRAPIETARAKEIGGEVVATVLCQNAIDKSLIGGRRSPAEGKRHRPQSQFDQPVAAARLEIILPFGNGAGNEFDLAVVQAELFIGFASLRLDCPVVRQEDTLRATFDDGRSNRGIGDVRERLRGENEGDVLLAQHFQPFADARGKKRIIQIDPGFIQNEERWPSGEACLQPMKEIGQNRQNDTRLVHQAFGFEALNICQSKPIFGRVQQLSERAFQRVGQKRRFERIRLEQYRQSRQRAFGGWRGGQARQSQPKGLFDLRGNAYLLVIEQRGDPLRRPTAFAGIVDTAQGLECERTAGT